MNTGRPIAQAVRYCCKGYIPTVDGESYEWYFDDSEDRGKVEYEESYWDRRGKWITRGWVLKWRAQFIKLWLDSTDDPHRWRKAREVADGISTAAGESKEQYQWTPTPQSISKHLRAYAEFYLEVFGMHMHMLNTPMYKGRMFKFIESDANPEYGLILEELANDQTWGRGKPVIRMNDQAWFRSMSEAERLTQVPYYQIYHCCERDILFCEVPLTGEKMRFRYATEVSK